MVKKKDNTPSVLDILEEKAKDMTNEDWKNFRERLDEELYEDGYFYGSHFKIEIPDDSQIGEKLKSSLDDIKSCAYCKKPVLFHDHTVYFTVLDVESEPIALDVIGMCSDCAQVIEKALQDAVAKIDVRKKKENSR